jgi:HSP20 family molecular chaperone IbpA
MRPNNSFLQSPNSINNSFQSFEQKSFIESVNGFKIYKLQLNVADFKAENLKINLNDFSLSISGFYEYESEPNSMKKTKRFNREIELPDFIDLTRMRSYLVPYEGSSILTIEAPVISAENNSFINGKKKSVAPILKRQNSNKNRSINDNNNSTCEATHEISSGILKYKFSLKDYRPQDISICVKDGKKLLINALNESFDHYGKLCREFVREINLPQDVDPYKIKNCYDPIDGILRIEIPLENLADIEEPKLETKSTDKTTQNGKFEKVNLNGDHLQLDFDLTDYELNNVKIIQQKKSKLLQIFAMKKPIINTNGFIDRRRNDEDCEKKVSYMLPNWVDCNNYKVYKKALDNSNKNIIVVKLPILKQFLANGDVNNENYERNYV